MWALSSPILGLKPGNYHIRKNAAAGVSKRGEAPERTLITAMLLPVFEELRRSLRRGDTLGAKVLDHRLELPGGFVVGITHDRLGGSESGLMDSSGDQAR